MPEGKVLTEDAVAAYLAEHADQLKDIFPSEGPAAVDLAVMIRERATVTPILGGNVNYAFRVAWEGPQNSKDSNDSSVTITTAFVKQAPEYVAIFGPDGFPLTSERMQQEMDVYQEWRALLGEPGARKYLPQIYFFDKSHMTVCMEFFDGYQLLDHVLVDPMVETMYHAQAAKGLGDFMGRTHAATHSSKIDATRKEYLVQHYENRAMRDVQLEFVFTKCYKEATDEQRAGLSVNQAFLDEIDLLKKQYDGKTDSLVLSHGDLHPGSVMVDDKGNVKVIDPEFTVYGPPGLDVGSLMSGFVLGAIHQAYSGNPEAVHIIVQGASDIWNAYVDAMKAGGIDDQELLQSIEVETVGFTVAEVCRTAMEFAGGRKWLQFDDPDTKAAAKKAALEVVEQCMIPRHEGGIELLFNVMKSVSKS